VQAQTTPFFGYSDILDLAQKSQAGTSVATEVKVVCFFSMGQEIRQQYTDMTSETPDNSIPTQINILQSPESFPRRAKDRAHLREWKDLVCVVFWSSFIHFI